MADKRLELAQQVTDLLMRADATPSERSGALAVALELADRDNIEKFKADLGVADVVAQPQESAPCS